MSWIDRVNNVDFTIVTGDGKGYLPKWEDPSKYIEFNIAEFVFRGIDGSLVRRGNPRGRQYNIDISFDGVNHLDTANQFDESSKDPRPWNVKHPLYGAILVQPANLKFDNRKPNVTKITGLLIETLGASTIFVEESEPDGITANANNLSKGMSSSYAADVPELKTADVQTLSAHINGAFNTVMGLMNGVQRNVDQYRDYYNRANALLNTTIYDSMKIIEATQRLIGAPFDFADTVVNRLNMFNVQIELFNRDVASILALQNRPTATLKRLYENNTAMAILGMCQAAVNNVGGAYNYKPSVLSVISTIITAHNTFLQNLTLLQSPNGGSPGYYLPNPVNITQLSSLVNATTSALFKMSAGAKQQRIKILTEDSNVLLLAYDLYGMQPDDSTVTTLIENNNIGQNEYLMLEKGREIIYYV
jgi:hypothetical protein